LFLSTRRGVGWRSRAGWPGSAAAPGRGGGGRPGCRARRRSRV